jgi:hypothetical protein
MDKTLKILTHPDGKRRVLIVQRENGQYGFEEHHLVRVYDKILYPDRSEMMWAPPLNESSFCICDSPEAAEREARDRIGWLQSS